MLDITPVHIVQFGVYAIAIAGVWFRTQFKIERMEERFSEHVTEDDKRHAELERQKDALWAWIDGHEKDAGKTRELFQKEISEIRGEQRVNIEQFKQVLGLLTEIKERLTRLENKN